MTDDDFAAVEQRIREREAEPFLTLSGKPLTYMVDGDRIKFSRVKTRFSTMEGARRIWEMGPQARLAEVDESIVGRAYLFAVLRDPRITA